MAEKNKRFIPFGGTRKPTGREIGPGVVGVRNPSDGSLWRFGGPGNMETYRWNGQSKKFELLSKEELAEEMKKLSPADIARNKRQEEKTRQQQLKENEKEFDEFYNAYIDKEIEKIIENEYEGGTNTINVYYGEPQKPVTADSKFARTRSLRARFGRERDKLKPYVIQAMEEGLSPVEAATASVIILGELVPRKGLVGGTDLPIDLEERINSSSARTVFREYIDPQNLAGRRADAERYQAMADSIAEEKRKQDQATTRPVTTPNAGAGFPTTTADTAERRAQQVVSETQEGVSPQVETPLVNGEDQNIIDEEKQQRKSTIEIVNNMMTALGFEITPELTNLAVKLYNESPTETHVLVGMRGTKEYANRFPGIEELRKNNPAFNESDYVAAEKSYNQSALRLPESVRPGRQEIGNLITAGVSPQEYSDRIESYFSWVDNADPFVKEALAKNYGLTKNEDIVELVLNPEKTKREIERMQNVTSFDQYLLRQKLSISTGYLEQLSDMGKSVQEVSRAGEQVATGKDTLGLLSSIERTAGLTEEQQLAGELGTNLEARTQASRLKSRERARFSQSGGGTQMFGRDLSASY